jgi:hypothetical protein
MGMGSEMLDLEPDSGSTAGDAWDDLRRDCIRSWLNAWTASASTSRDREACLREDLDVDVDV